MPRVLYQTVPNQTTNPLGYLFCAIAHVAMGTRHGRYLQRRYTLRTLATLATMAPVVAPVGAFATTMVR